METKVYIQAFNNFPIADWAVSAYMGFKEKQANIIFFEDIEEVPASRNNIVVAFIEDTNKYLERLGIGPKIALNIPKELEKYTGREIRYMSMAEFKKDAQLPVFVKPARRSKEFQAGVLTLQSSKDTFFNEHSDDTPVLVSEVVDFVSEYRGYVIDGTLQGIKHYLGNFRVFPDMKIVDAAIADFKSQPAGYSIDFGITSDGRTLLVECNDGWGLGNYGLNDVTYSTLLAKRWRELMGKYSWNQHFLA